MMRPSEGPTEGIPINELTSVISKFDEQVSMMTVRQRNDRDDIRDAMDGTIEWYDRNVHSRTGRPLSPSQRRELADIMERETPAIIATRNADRLVNDLTSLDGELAASGLGVREMRRLESEIEFMRRDLLRDGHYHKEHDDALVRMAAVLKTAKGAWAENHLGTIEQYLGNDRWWLR